MVDNALRLLMFLYAFSMTILGPLLPDLMRHYGLGIAQGGLITSVQNIGGLASVVLGLVVTDRLPKAVFIGAVFALYGCALLAAAAGPSFSLLLALFFLIGASTRLLDTASNAYTADLHGPFRRRALGYLHAAFGLGALSGPLYVRVVLSGARDFRTVFGGLGLACLCALAFYGFAERGSRRGVAVAPWAPGAPGAPPRTPAASPMTSVPMWVLALVMFLYVAHQSGLSLWLPLFAEKELGATADLAAASLTGLWVGVVVGRLAWNPIAARVGQTRLLTIGLVAGGAVLAYGLAASATAVLVIAAVLCGFFTSGVVPALVDIGSGWFPGHTGAVSSIIFLAASASRIVFPYAVGPAAVAWGLGNAMQITALPLLAGAVKMVVLNRRGRGYKM